MSATPAGAPKTSAVSRDEAERTLAATFGINGFRTGQWEAVSAALAGQDVAVYLPTGAGKSLCYQLPALLGCGVVLVISPLLSLMDDQVAALRKRGVRARALSSARSAAENKESMRLLACSPPELELLYCSPESAIHAKLLPVIVGLSRSGQLPLIAIDEAHCISTWGHDFRHAYLRLGDVLQRELRPDNARCPTALMALSATATAEVRADVSERLRLRSATTVTASFDRAEIFYEVVLSDALPQGVSPYAHLLERLRSPAAAGSGIVYCGTRDDTSSLAASLSGDGVKAAAYHAGLSSSERASAQQAWLTGSVRVMVATVAFGMGIDKADVRFVVHWAVPQSFEAFYQESGRAARDGKPAVSTVYFSADDASLRRFLITKTNGGQQQGGGQQSGGQQGGGQQSGGKQHGAQQKMLSRRLGAFDSVVDHCLAASGCRRATLLGHFGEALGHFGEALQVPRDAHLRPSCCDLCARPEAAAAAAAKLRLQDLVGSAGAGSGRGRGGRGGRAEEEEDEASAARAGRKRSKRDPHDSGLVDSAGSGEESDEGRRGGGGGIARAGGRQSVVAPARGPRLSKAELSARLTRLEELEEEEEGEEAGRSAASALRARLG